MSSSFGKQLKVSVFGQSHGRAVGVNVEGLPAGETVDMEELRAFLGRRAPGRGKLVTQRREADEPVFLSGLEEGRTCGFPLAAIIENTDTRSSDYKTMERIPRPGHADFTAFLRYGGQADMRGGGHFSGRLTAPLCIAGGIAKQVLARRGVYVGAHLLSVGKARDASFDPVELAAETLLGPGRRSFPVLDENAERAMTMEIQAAKDVCDSVGGVVECAAVGLPAGMGDPMFDGVENQLAAALFGIPAVKGVEFGAGFAAAQMRGSQNNDPFTVKNGQILTTTNNAGGALGGITTGMPLILRTAIKPTPSIAQKQRSVDLGTGEEAELEIKGRHDPCIALRAVPCVEAVTALVILDLLLQAGRV
ncbi:chorismate synthase [Bacilliculturomica massiliensis]|uniref:chorismate synthase n=1 Tax=Bacilliculturomica massiliensis TaxID=1917867 RepID=UPI0010321C78|nr:chorismate synthase [Bacilliculturomica massiliensis]